MEHQIQRIYHLFGSIGLIKRTTDSCVYYRHLCKRKADEEINMFILNVDEGLIISSIKAVIDEMMAFFTEEFDVRSLPPDRLIGININ